MQVSQVSPDRSWREKSRHSEDVLCAAFVPPTFMATASFDGEINVWHTDSRSLYTRLRRGQPARM